MQINVKIKRFDPEADRRPYWAEYTLEARGSDRVLDVINHLKWEVDGSLAFRRSCAHGICGSDAMLINGVNRLACKVLVKDLGERITIEPIRGLPVLKDLIVDMEPFFDAYKAVLPFFINDDPPPPAERHQSPEDRAIFDETTKCILCAACTTSCPVFWTNGRYLGPAAIVNAHRFIFDSRDQGAAERLGVLNQANGLWRCRTAYNCTEACPRDIPITELMATLREMAVEKGYAEDLEAEFGRSFAETFQHYGRLFEPELMIRYFLRTFDIKGMLGMLPLALPMVLKGKLPFFPEKVQAPAQMKALVPEPHVVSAEVKQRRKHWLPWLAGGLAMLLGAGVSGAAWRSASRRAKEGRR